MKIFEKSFRITASAIIFIVLSLATIFLVVIYWKTENNPWSSILGSLIAGLIVAIIQFLIAWQDYKENEKLKKLKLIEILYNRDNRSWYANYITEATKRIDIMGVTAVRFFDHFVNTDINAPKEAKVIINALQSGVNVRLLLPAEKYLPTADKKQDAAKVKKKYLALKETYPNLEMKYFQHVPAHSVFRVDDECIVGPVFPELESKYTPGLRLKNKSPLASKYIEYFEKEWNNASQA